MRGITEPIRRSLLDWRAWVAVGCLALIFALDQLTPHMTAAPFLAVPVVAAATFAPPVLVGILALAAAGVDLVAGWLHGDWQVTDYWHRFGALVVVGIVAVIIAVAAEQARTQLRQSEERSRLLAENASDIVVVLAGDGVVQWISPSITAALGWDAEDIVGRQPCWLIRGKHVAVVQAAWEQIQAGAAAWAAVEFQAIRSDGNYAWLSATGRRANPGTIVAGIRDVTEQVENRMELQRAEELYRRLAEDMSDVVWTLDVETLRFTYVSPSVFQLRGYTPEEVMATPMDAALTAEDAGRIRALLAARSSGARGPSGAPYVEEVLQPRKDGSTVWTEVVTRYLVDPDTGRTQVHGVSRDITNRRLAESTLAASEARLNMVINASSDVVVQESKALIEWVSPALTPSLGWLPEQWQGHHLTEFLHEDDIPAQELKRASDDPLPTYRCRLRTADGSYRWMDVHSATFERATGTPWIISTMRDIDEAVHRERDLLRRATIDELTGALNREAGLSILQDVTDRRSLGGVTAVLYCDVDHFKGINDAHGHGAGDGVLSVVCERIRLRLRETDIVIRLGGDEFLVVIEGLRDAAGATRVAEAIRASVATPFHSADDAIAVSISVGLTLMTPDDDATTLVSRADQAMYLAKNAGRNRVVMG